MKCAWMIFGLGVILLALVILCAYKTKHDQPTSPHHYSIKCIRRDGKIIYEDQSQFAPHVYRNPFVTCIVTPEPHPLTP